MQNAFEMPEVDPTQPSDERLANDPAQLSNGMAESAARSIQAMATLSPTLPGRKKRHRRSRRLVALWCGLGLLILVVGLSGTFLYSYQKYIAQYHLNTALAKDGIQHLQNAENLAKKLQGALTLQGVEQTHQEFVGALSDFNQTNTDLNQLPRGATNIPKYGSLLQAALKLVPIAINVSQAGIVGCDALALVMADLGSPLDNHGLGITLADITSIRNDLTSLQGLLQTTTGQINQLQPSDLQLDPRLAPMIAKFRVALPGIQMGLQNAWTIAQVVPTLLGVGTPALYLVEQLDSTEIRPGGGFIGSYGIATIASGRLTNIFMRDTYLLDDAFTAKGGKIPYPSVYKSWFGLAPSWSLRDSNLDADFPTAARYAEQIYHTEGGTGTFQGVIAITPWLIEDTLKITGPIYVSEYNETITSQNVVDRIHYHQLKEEWGSGDVPSPDGHSSLRKRFTEILFEHFLARLRQISHTATLQLVSLLHNALSTKDLQVYFNASAVEDVLQYYHQASTIQAPQGDSLFIVDANLSGGKPNNFIQYTLQDNVTIDSSGNALHTALFTYNWPESSNQFQNGFGSQSLYSDYLRVYAPPGSTLLTQSGWDARGASVAFGRQVWDGFLHLPYGQSRTIKLTWIVHQAATHTTTGWQYHYLLQRQAGITWHVNVEIALPACAHRPGTTYGLALTDPHNAKFSRDLGVDVDLGVTYLC